MNSINFLDILDSTSSASSSSSSGEFFELFEEILNLPTNPKPKTSQTRNNIINKYDDDEFERRFRLPKELFLSVVEKIKSKLKYPTMRNNPLSVEEQLLITLRYYATGSFQIVCGDLFNCNQSTVSRIIVRVSKAIAELSEDEIKFANLAEARAITEKFYSVAGIPNIIGIIDGTHIPIQSPGGNEGEQFRNRKGFFSINTQIVCDVNSKIIDINARWPGSTHDQMVFNFSKLRARLEAGELEPGILIGDSGYACKKYLITPLSNPTTRQEIAFQKALVKTRIIVERTIGIWKRRFPVIGTKIRINIHTALIVIVATAVLHNMLKERIVPPPEINIIMDEPSTVTVANGANDFGKRNQIITNFF